MIEEQGIFRWLFVYALIVLQLGCAITSGGLPAGAPGPAPVIPVRDILFSGETPASGYWGYGYLIFTRRPNEKEIIRYLSVCRAYVRTLESVSQYNLPKQTEMPTYWLATYGINKSDADCKNMVDRYDYARAKIMASAISALQKRGPLLVAWSTPFEKVHNGEKALQLDLSDFANEDLDRAFGIWMNQITRDPKMWHDGWNLTLAKEAFRSFLERYGENIVTAIFTVKKIMGKAPGSEAILTMARSHTNR